MFAPVYLDHNATTPLDPRVLEAMMPWLTLQYGNASSRHEYGRAARQAIDDARNRVASAVGAHATEVVFCSGGSEANNLFLKGAAALFKPASLAVSAIEHPCVGRAADDLKRVGWTVSRIDVDGEGRIDQDAYAQVLTRAPRMVSVMLANNETGVVQDVAQLAAQARGVRAWFHTDAVQALGKMPVSFRALGVNALTVSAHKLGGPKGAAALVLDKRVELRPLISGGGQERGQRSGTENVAAIVGFGMACELAVACLDAQRAQVRTLQVDLEAGLTRLGARLFSQGAPRLPNTSFFALNELDGETLVGQLDRAGYAVASGAACSSANPEPSGTLLAMGVAPQVARGAVRVSLGAGNTAADIHGFLRTLEATIGRLRGMSSIAA